MDEPIELYNIMAHTTSVVDETTYETPVASRDEEHEYMKIDTVAERMTTPGHPEIYQQETLT